MKKYLIAASILSLTTSVANANITNRAIVKKDTTDTSEEITLPITVNNQTSVEITSDSSLIPAEFKVINPIDAAVFDIQLPKRTGTYQVKYFNGSQGCDFYFDIQSMGGGFTAYVTGIAIDNSSACSVFPVNGVNHLAVSFLRF